MRNMVETISGGFISLTDISEIEFTSREMNDSTVTIKEWLLELLCNVWDEKDEFSGKRAFGNSDWEYDIYETLYRNRIIAGVMTEWDELDLPLKERQKADKIILDIIVEVL